MAVTLDFPPTPILGQRYTAPTGAVYMWDGVAWTVGFYDSSSEAMSVLGDLLAQIRTTLMDTDTSSGQYRYSTDSIVTNINQGMLEMLRMRPDIFLENGFKAPTFNDNDLSTPLVIEPQFVPALVYYAVGFTQMRDDEATEDSRGSAFLGKFASMLMAVA
jgi:hypothetical protein